MIPRLITEGEVLKQNVDYTSGTFTRQYELDGCIYYFAVFPEMYRSSDVDFENDSSNEVENANTALENSGNLLIVLLYPGGLVTFDMFLDDDTWRLTENYNELAAIDSLVPDEIIKMISDCIDSHNL